MNHVKCAEGRKIDPGRMFGSLNGNVRTRGIEYIEA